MEIRGYGDEFVQLIPRFVSLPKDSSSTIECSCAMAAHRFAGATYPDEPVVCIGREALTRFVDDVRVLERDRHGEATLECRELRLTLWVTDRAGHVHLQATLTEQQSGGIHQVTIAFEVDPSTVPGILSDVEGLLAFPDSERPDTDFNH